MVCERKMKFFFFINIYFRLEYVYFNIFSISLTVYFSIWFGELKLIYSSIMLICIELTTTKNIYEFNK